MAEKKSGAAGTAKMVTRKKKATPAKKKPPVGKPPFVPIPISKSGKAPTIQAPTETKETGSDDRSPYEPIRISRVGTAPAPMPAPRRSRR
jgi:hypothetical protein